jgi:glyoxylase I family protein
MGFDSNTPDWVQHIAFELEDLAALDSAHERLLAEGLEVVGPTDHGIFQSLYFRDPNGHRIELAVNTSSQQDMAKLHAVAPLMLEEWSRTRRAPRHAAWLHEKQLTGDRK